MSRNADVSVLWLNAPFISARIRLSGECCRVHSRVRRRRNAFHLLRSVECRPFAPADVIQPSVIRDEIYIYICFSRHPVRIYFFVHNRNAAVPEHLYSSTVTCQTGRAKKGLHLRQKGLPVAEIFLYLFPTFSWMSLRFLRTWGAT